MDAAFAKVARIYQRECRLDHAPSDWKGPHRSEVVDGRLLAFALAVGGDKPSLEHLWTCAAQRRRGIATELVRALVEDLGSPLVVWHVVSEGGAGWRDSAQERRLVHAE